MPKQRFKHTVVTNCSLRDVYEKEKDGREVCGVDRAPGYFNPTIYFKQPYEEQTNQKSSEQS